MSKRKDDIAILTRRMKWLEKRLDTYPSTYDRAEWSALKRVITLLENITNEEYLAKPKSVLDNWISRQGMDEVFE